jgi:hypothetical protein
MAAPDQADPNVALAQHIALALASDAQVVLELRKQSDGSYRPVLDPYQVTGIVLKVLEEERLAGG